jgi:hypothetical protein
MPPVVGEQDVARESPSWGGWAWSGRILAGAAVCGHVVCSKKESVIEFVGASQLSHPAGLTGPPSAGRADAGRCRASPPLSWSMPTPSPSQVPSDSAFGGRRGVPRVPYYHVVHWLLS